MQGRHRSVVLHCVVAAAAWGMSARAESWPEVKTPPGARVQTVASDMVLNGRPSRVIRFNVQATDTDVLAFYREEFGAKRVVENRVKNDPVIATRQGDYFLTVQLHPLDSHTLQGTVMTTSMAGKPVASVVALDTHKIMPVDTAVVSTMQSDDAGKRSLMIVGVNKNSVRANRDHVLAAMTERGFRVTKEDASPSNQDAAAVSLVLSSSTEEASVTISDAGPYRAVVINRMREAK